MNGPSLTGCYYFEGHEIRPKVRTGGARFLVLVDAQPLKNARGALRTFKTREQAAQAGKAQILSGAR